MVLNCLKHITFLLLSKHFSCGDVFKAHLACMWQWQQIWKYIQTTVDSKIENKLDDIYRNLNKKLCILKRTNNNQNKTTSQMTKHNLYTPKTCHR